MTDNAIIFETIRPWLDSTGFGAGRPAILDAACARFLTAAAPAAPHPILTPAPAPEIGLTMADFTAASSELGCTVPQVRAVDETESGGGWFEDVRADILNLDGPGGFLDGPNLPKTLFEATPFSQRTDHKYDHTYPNISSRTWNRALYVGGQGEYVRLYHAMQLDAHAALLSASVGRYQIMGFNHVAAGFATVEAFWEAMKESERRHLDAFVSFIRNSRLTGALRKISNVPAECQPFASGYNGAGYARNQYDVKIAQAHKKWSSK